MRDALNRPLRDLRLSVTDRCNFRCAYCMPAGRAYDFLPVKRLLTYERMETVARAFVRHGVEKLRITGGEPLIRRQLPVLVEKLAAIPGVRDIALTTNAHFLADQARALRDAGLRRITVSLDALDPAVAARMSGGRCDLPRVLDAIDAAAALGFPIKLNTVVRKGDNDGEILPLVEYARRGGHTVRFIEYMDVGNLNGWNMERVLPSRDVVAMINAVHPCAPAAPNYPGEVAARHRFLDGGGEFGVISSVTQPFCGGCARARVSAKGVVYTCLFAAGGHDLKPFFREADPEAAIGAAIGRIWPARRDRYSEERARGLPAEKVEMYEMGG